MKSKNIVYDTGVAPVRIAGSFDIPGYYAVGQCAGVF